MVGVSEGMKLGAWNSVGSAFGIAMGCLLGVSAASANWCFFVFLDALGGSPVGALFSIGAVLLRVGYRWNISTLGGAAVSVFESAGTLGGCTLSPFAIVAFLNMVAKCRKAVMCSWCSVGNGVAGAGFVNAITSSWAAIRAASADDVAGILQ
jgi:hypothetical protein